ncbi:MAG TPA: threonine/serine dehydratase [Gemmatimonadales bacterium]|jgi:threonine dehydratase
MIAIDLANLREARDGLAGVAERTPLIPLPLDGVHDVRLKAEHLQPIGAFKIRGAWTALRRLDADGRRRGVVTSSSGNHGLGVAFAAQRLGIRAVVVMPESAAAVKIDGVRRLGAEVVLQGKTRGAEQTVAAERFVAEEGLVMIPPFDHPDVIAGQGTCGLELLEQWPDVRTILVPVGGGGLLAGICSAVRATGANVRVIAVEPAAIPKLSAAMAADRPTTLTGGASLADGLLTKSVGALTFPLIRVTVSRVIGVTDDEIRDAMRWLGDHDLRVEPSGSATTAAVLAGHHLVDGPTALVCTGGNVDPARYQELAGR